MKRYRLLFAALGLIFGLAAAQPAQAQLGVAAGLNFNSMGDIDFGTDVADAEATYENSTGFHFGLFYDLAVGPLAVRPGVFYRQAGKYEGVAALEDEVSAFDLSLIEIPLDLRFRLAALPLIKPYLLGGPVLMLPQGEGNFDEALNDISFAGNVGAGVEVSLGGIRLMPEIRYSFGVSNFVKEDPTIGGVDFQASDGERLSAVMLRLNIGI